MRKFLALTLAAAALAAGGVAYAQQGVATDQPAPRAAAPMGRPDPAQREARQRAMFDRLDADHNGSISYAEFAALRERMGERMQQRGGQRFEGFGSGRGPMPRGPMARGPMEQGPGFAGPPPGGPQGPLPRGERGAGLGAGIDGNRDGTVSREEFLAAAQQRFDRLDANHDGKVTPDERRGAMQGRGPAGN